MSATISGTAFIYAGSKQYTVDLATGDVLDIHTGSIVVSSDGITCYSADGTTLGGVAITSNHSAVHLFDPSNDWIQTESAQMAGGIGPTYVYDISCDIEQSEMVFYGIGQNTPPFPQILPPGSYGIVRYSAWDGASVGFTVMNHGPARMAVNNASVDSEIVLLTGPPGLMVMRLDPYSGAVKSSFYVGDVLPTPAYNSIYPYFIDVDGGGNLIITYRNSSTSSDIYIFNGISNDLQTVIPFVSGYLQGFCVWAPSTVSYEPITGIPEIDGILQVVDGVWENPNGPDSPGAYVSEVVKVAKLLGYRGTALADIIKAANSSGVNK